VRLPIDNYGYNLALGGEAVRFNEVLDGLSRTCVISETVLVEDRSTSPPTTAAPSACVGAFAEPHLSVSTVSVSSLVTPSDGVYHAASSYHHRGAHFGLFDGSVRMLSFGTDPEVLDALSTLDGGEIFALP